MSGPPFRGGPLSSERQSANSATSRRNSSAVIRNGRTASADGGRLYFCDQPGSRVIVLSKKK